MVREVGVHDNDKVSGCELHSMDVRGSKAELAGARFEDDVVGSVGFDELLGDFLGAVGGAVVDDDDFIVKFADIECEYILYWSRSVSRRLTAR